MYYFLTASKDASIYLQQPNQNTGLDEILEVSKVYYGNIKDIAKSLIKFEVGYLSASLSDTSISMSEATLILRDTESNEIPLEYTLYVNAVSGAWEMGNGTRFDNISTAGVTWNYREGDSQLEWIENTLNLGTTSSNANGTGGTWWTAEVYGSSKTYNYETADLVVDVKPILQSWMSGSIPNDGFIIRFGIEEEKDTLDYGQIKFFSKETNTIHQPKVRIGWDDQTYETGSLTALQSDEMVVVPKLAEEYKLNSVPKIRVSAREKYPLKTFVNTFAYGTTQYLPTTSYYQIRDFASGDIIVPFSDYTKLSCDSTGNYIKVNFSNWEAGRTYKIEFKVIYDSQSYYFDDDFTFRLVKD
jgi:hypothetical protein